MPSILLTGAGGFIGQALSNRLKDIGRSVVPAVRQSKENHNIAVGDIGPQTKWSIALRECEVVVHLAARVHVMRDTASDPLDQFRTVNTDGTLNLARQAALAGVRRFIFVSSIKVNGESGIFSITDPPAPQDPYSVSKWEAEQGLHDISHKTGMEVTILRPPLVYGPGVGANFLRLMHLIEYGVPFPFSTISNQRSLIYLGNLIDAIVTCLDHPAAANKAFLVSDGEDISTPDLIRQLAFALGRPARLWPVPERVMSMAGYFFGKEQEIRRLLGSLVVDSSVIHHDLGWHPPFSMQEGLLVTAKWFRHLHPR